MRRFVAAAVFFFVAAYAPAHGFGQQTGPSVVLLSDGRLLSGEVTKEGNRYRIKKAYGTIELTGDQVLGVFPDMRKAYEFQKSQLSGAEADEYVRLAFWCLRYKLFAEARDCVREAISIEPSNSRLHRLLKQIDQQERLAKRKRSEPAGVGLRPAAYTPASVGSAARPIPQKAVELFARRIQPLVSRRCAAASCHGPRSRASFTLWPSMYPAPAVTHYNIRQLTHYIDWHSPEKSPLLVKAIVPHGGAISPPLPRRQDDPAFATLYEWVKVLVETDPLATKDDAKDDEQKPPPLLPAPAGPPARLQDESTSEDRARSSAADAMQSELSATEPAERLGPKQEASNAGQTDPFDPEEFNRRFYDPRTKSDDHPQGE